MFAGAVIGWKHFTPEFQIGGIFDQLTAWQRQVLFLLSTNCVSEGVLGEKRIDYRENPNSSLETFSNKTRGRRNNTEAFIKKRCSTAVRAFVRAEVRRGSKTARKHEFWSAWAQFQRQKAAQGLQRRRKAKERRDAADAKLAAIELVLDLAVIEVMTSDKLREQLQYHRDILRDEILLGKKWKDDDMRLVGGRRELVKAARLRELQRRASEQPIAPSNSPENTTAAEIDDDDEMDDNDADWEDIDG
uniref:Uncharacterized protein n=1 Tax=Mycena chlorophos TaxID=658473 RepID=A0ABQ0L9Q9_MYCCL|nr:predicted protein [Mycena chlorophos]